LDVKIDAPRVVVRIENTLAQMNILVVCGGIQFPNKPVVRCSIQRCSIEAFSVLFCLSQ